MLRGEGLRLEPGAYAFVDGNAMGGIGVVLVEQGESGPVSVRDLATTVYDVFGRAGIPSLDTRSKITAATDSLQNILAELGALYAALKEAAPGSTLTVVHDYEGVGAWLEGRWKAKNPIVAEVVAACQALIDTRGLRVRFRHQRGHESTFAGRNDFAAYNARADKLATDAGLRPA
jgi:arylsulfatase A-like enzyme